MENSVPFCTVDLPDFERVRELLKITEKAQLSNGGPLYKMSTEKLHKTFDLNPDQKVVVTSSGHTALMAAYAISQSKRFLMPSYTFESTRVAATLQGFEVILTDVDPETACLTPEILASVSIDSYDAVVLVFPLSIVPDVEGIAKYCQLHGKRLIIDAAAAFGTPYSYMKHADFVCMSFHATKTLPVGECGCLIVKDEQVSEVLSYITFGLSTSRVPIRTGLNAKISDYTAAILLAMLDKQYDILDKRQKNTELYISSGLDKYMMKSKERNTVYQTLPLFFDKDTAARVRSQLTESGIDNKQYYLPLTTHTVSTQLYQGNVCIPCHPFVTRQQQETIISIIEEVLHS